MPDDEIADDAPVPGEHEPTVPQFTVTLKGLEGEPAQLLGRKVHDYVTVLSRYMDLQRLDGVTVGVDYPAALAELDRGFEANEPLMATNDEIAVGAAMAPAVMRDGEVKAHIVLSANAVWPLTFEARDESHKQAIYVLAHECAHVEVTKSNDIAIPGSILQKTHDDVDDYVRWNIIFACWDEYAASRISASFGIQWPTYEQTFVTAIRETWPRANSFIRSYRYHSDHRQVIGEVAGAYGNLMKYASYLLGDLHGHGLSDATAEDAKRELDEDWFGPYFERLSQALAAAWEHRGTLKFRELAEVIGVIGLEVIEEGGMFFEKGPNGQVRLDVPFTPFTMPVV
jgi:hypothetical protein